jgi:hypothetical protein
VAVSGADTTGARFNRSWSFSTGAEPPSKNFLTIAVPQPNANVGRTFTVRGTTLPNARVRIVAGRLKLTTIRDVFDFMAGNVTATAVAGPRGNFEQSITIALPVAARVGVTVTSTAPRSDETAQVRLRLNGIVPQPR